MLKYFRKSKSTSRVKSSESLKVFKIRNKARNYNHPKSSSFGLLTADPWRSPKTAMLSFGVKGSEMKGFKNQCDYSKTKMASKIFNSG